MLFSTNVLTLCPFKTEQKPLLGSELVVFFLLIPFLMDISSRELLVELLISSSFWRASRAFLKLFFFAVLFSVSTFSISMVFGCCLMTLRTVLA